MLASGSTTPFRQGAGRLSLDFIRTLRHRGRATVSEELADPQALLNWVEQFGPWAAHPSSGPSVAPPSLLRLRQARRLREAIYELVTSALVGQADGAHSEPSADQGRWVDRWPPGSRELINQAASRPVPAPELDAAGRLGWRADDPVSATLALVARDALDLVGSAAVQRVRGCANPDCGALFYDGSRPGVRRWCAMGICGNGSKKANQAKRLRSRIS